jgi:hypothetical protein
MAMTTWLALVVTSGLFMLVSYGLEFIFFFDEKERGDLYMAFEAMGSLKIPGVRFVLKKLRIRDVS